MGKNADRRREERRLRKADRQNARTARAESRNLTKQTAYNAGMDPNATLNNFVNTAGGIVSGVIAGKKAGNAGGGIGSGKSGTGGGDDEPFDFQEWFEDNKSLVLGAGGLLVGTKLLKLW